MHAISKYVGQKVRRITFALRRTDGTYVNVFALIEHLNPGMQDADAFAPSFGAAFVDCIKKVSGKSNKVFFGVDYADLTEEMVANPMENIIVGANKLQPIDSKYDWASESSTIVPLHSDNKTELIQLLPKREEVAYVSYCLPSDGNVVKDILADRKIADQISELSIKNLGYDLTTHSKFIGSYLFVCYNHIYKDIELTEDSNASGVYCRVNYHNGSRETLTFRIRCFAKDNQTIGCYEFCNRGKKLSYFAIPHKLQSLSIDVYDSQDMLIDFYPRVSFLHSILFSMDVKSKDVLVDENGEQRVIEKFVSDGTLVVGERPVINSFFDASPEYTYKHFEDSLDFVFFDGDKDHCEENKKKAKACVMRILNSARQYCYICDVYFNADTFCDFVLEMSNASVDVRILSSKEQLNNDQQDHMRTAIAEINGKGIGNVECRLLKGDKAALHDRLIVADNNVWMLGCSLNEYGVRATSLVRVPREYCGKILSQVEDWWNDGDKSEKL